MGEPDEVASEQRADPVDRLVELLDLDGVGVDAYGSPNPDRGYGDRVFGGQVAAQSLVAALRTVDGERRPHSLHAYFLRPGRPGRPLRFEVDRIRDGNSFTTRRVVVWQDEPIFNASISFHLPEDGPDYQQPIALDVPSPDESPDDMGFIPEDVRDQVPMEFREIGPSEPDDRGWYPSTRRVWIRIRRPLPDDPDLHVSLLAFLSDMGAVMGARAPIPEQPLDRLMGASLDHALWFHRPIRADEWFLFDLHAVSNGNARGLTVGTMHAEDGTLGLSIAQEALLRILDPDRPRTSLADDPKREID